MNEKNTFAVDFKFSEEGRFYLNTDPHELVTMIEAMGNTLARMKSALESKQRFCAHEWGETRYTPNIREGYQDPGDPPGTMGVDHRGPMWVPRQEVPRWTRTCTKCTRTETTSHTRDDVKKVPVF